MTTTEQIEARLAEVLPVYEEIKEKLREWKKLQQAEAARAEYERQTSEFDQKLNELVKEKDQLEADKRKRELEDKIGPGYFRPPLTATLQPPVSPRGPVHPNPKPPAINQEAIQGARRQLKKLVGRWGRVWRLSTDAQGHINRIADDPARPLGEALAMLDWDTFKQPIGSGESEVEHLERLSGWGAALFEYRAWLEGNIDMLKTKYRRVLPLLDAWVERDGEAGRIRWEKQIAETLDAKRQEVKTLSADILTLKAVIAEQKARR